MSAMEKWLDCHCHVLGGGTEAVRELDRCQREDYGRCASNFLSVEGMDDAAQNALGICFKLLNPRNYAFGGLHYRFSYDFGEEVRKLAEIGFDGIKMIENKPSERKRLGFRQDDPRYDSLYRTVTALDLPMLIHVNDPAENWDWNRCSDWAKEQGYYYGGGDYVSYEQVTAETVSMLEKYPHMRVCLAHLFFMSDDEPRLRTLMERFPNLSLDITAGTEMYYAFDDAPAVWRQFFLDYADRILFGTDNCCPASEFDRKIAGEINDLERDFLTRSDRFPLWDRRIQGAGLPETVVRKITHDNFRAFAGRKPKPLNTEKAAAYLRGRLENGEYRLRETERETIQTVLEMLKGREIL